MAMVTCLKELHSEGHYNIVTLLVFNFYFKSLLYFFFHHYAVVFYASSFFDSYYFKTEFCRLSFLWVLFSSCTLKRSICMKNRVQNVCITLTARYMWGFQKYLSGKVSLALVGAGLTLCPLENSASIATAIVKTIS